MRDGGLLQCVMIVQLQKQCSHNDAAISGATSSSVNGRQWRI